MKELAKLLSKAPKILVVPLAILLLVGLAWIDYRTGKAVRFSIFYWLPIAAVTWRAGRGRGLAMVTTSSLARLWTDWHDMLAKGNAGYIALDLLFWLMSFSVLCILLGKLRELAELHESLRTQTTLPACLMPEPSPSQSIAKWCFRLSVVLEMPPVRLGT